MGDGLSESTRRLRLKLIAGVVLAVIAIAVGGIVSVSATDGGFAIVSWFLVIGGGFLLLWFGWLLFQYEWARSRRR
jgi:hypothetical protein